MRKNIVAGNWKMNNDLKATKKLVKQIKKSIKFYGNCNYSKYLSNLI